MSAPATGSEPATVTDVFRFAKTVSDCSIESFTMLRADLQTFADIIRADHKLFSRLVGVIETMSARLDALEAKASQDRQG